MSGRISLLKLVDRLLGGVGILLAGLVLSDAKSSGTISSILLIRPGGIGDAIHLIPSILAMRVQYPLAHITVLAERRNAAAFLLCPEIDQILLYDRPADLITTLRGTYDVVMDTEQWYRLSAVVARLIHAPMLVGFATNERSRLFTHPVAYSQDDYEAESFLHLLAPLGIEHDPLPQRFLQIPPDARHRSEQLLAPLAGRPFVALFPGASIAERRWGADKFAQLQKLLSVMGVPAVVVGGREDRGQGDAIISAEAGINLAGRTTLPETAAIIDRSALLVSGDSGVLHIAVALGKPTVSLFGPGRWKKWAPRGDRHFVINKKLACSPCTTYGVTPKCLIKARCMQDISVDEVFNAVMMLLRSEEVVGSLCCKKDWIELSNPD